MTESMHCPNCSSENVIFSKKRGAYVCEDCSHVLAEAPVSPLRIFLSYGHDANEELVRRIKTDLEKRGHDVWFDKSEIKSGDDWRRSITEGIAGSHKFVSFLSKHSTRDPGVCRDEIAIAIGVKGGNIQTILVESEQEVQPPVNIGHIQWLDMHDWKERRERSSGLPPEHPDSWEQWYHAKLAEIVRVVESDESRRFAGEIETLNGYLKPIKAEARISQLLSKGFYGRRWLFEAVEKWRAALTEAPSRLSGEKFEASSESPSRLFWIMGEPGVGKSAFAAQLTHTRSDMVIAAQFCEWDKPDHRNAQRVVRSLAFQLATRLPDYRKLLLTLPEMAQLDRKDAAELFDYLLANPLRSVLHGGRERYLILIDALDEAGESGRNPLVEMLARNAHFLPDWLGIVVTSRPEFDVKTPLQALSPFPLDTQSEPNRADIRDYLRRKLATQLLNRPDADRLMGRILDKSEGVYLYVERFCDDVQRGYLSLDRPEQFPQGLGGIFCQYFQRQFPDLEKFRNDVRPALRAILAAREPLHVEILQSLFQWQDEELRDFIRLLASLFPVTREAGLEAIKPYHKSLADWLADEARAGTYYVSSMEGHRMLAEFGWREYQVGVRAMRPYNMRNLAAHLVSAQKWDDVCALLGDLQFVEIRCALGQVIELQADYRMALENLPEAQAEMANQGQRSIRVVRWTSEIIEYARQCYAGRRPPLPETVQSVEMWSSNKIEAESKRIVKNATRFDRMRAFAHFVESERYTLLEHAGRSGYVIHHALNSAPAGPVREAAASVLAGVKRPLLLRHWPPGAMQSPKPALTSTLEGHDSGVISVNLILNGQQAVSGSHDRTLRVWELGSGRCLRTLEGHSAGVFSVSVTPDGRLAVSGSEDRTLRMWDLSSGKCIRTLEGHSAGVFGVSVTPDGSRVVSASEDKTLRVWDLESGACLCTLNGHTAWVFCVVVTPDGRWAISGSYDNTLRVWDLEHGVCSRTLEGHSAGVFGVSVTPDGRRAVSGSYDNSLRVWDLENGECLRTLQDHKACVRSVCMTPDGRRAISGSYDKTVRVWDVERGTCLRTFEGHNDAVLCVSITPDGSRALSGGYETTLRIWDVESGLCRRVLERHSARVKGLSMTPDGRRAVSGSHDNTLRVWDPKGKACLRTLKGHCARVESVSIKPDGSRVVSGSEDMTLRVWDPERGALLRTLHGHKGGILGVSISSDGQRAMSASYDKTVRVWDLEGGVCLRTLTGHTEEVESVSTTADGRWAVSGSHDGTLRVWDLESGACLSILDGHCGGIRSVKVASDGRWAVSGGGDKTVRVWDLERGTCAHAFEGHSARILSVSMTADGRWAVSGSYDKTVRVWDLTDGECLALYSAPSPVVSVALSGNGTNICVGTQGGEVLFFEVCGFARCPELVRDGTRDPSGDG